MGWYAAIADLVDGLPASKFAPWQLKRLPDLVDGAFFTVAQQSNPAVPTELGYGCPTRPPDEPAFSITTQTSAWFKGFLVMTEHHTPSEQGREGRMGIIPPNDPANTVVTGSGSGNTKGCLLTGQYGQPAGVAERTVQGATTDDPSFTVTASNKGDWRAWLVESKQGNQIGGKGYRDQDEPAMTVVTDGTQSHVPKGWLDGGRVVAMTPRCLARFQSFPDWYELPAKNSLAALGIGNAVPPLLYQRIAETLKE